MSSSNFVAIQPARGPAGPGGAERRLSVKRKRENTRQACQICRQSKGKCDGTRPICGPCTEKGRVCNYEYTKAGVSRQAAMRSRLEFLEALFKQLRQATSPLAQRLFNGLRTNDDIQRLLLQPDSDSAEEDGEDADEDDEVDYSPVMSYLHPDDVKRRSSSLSQHVALRRGSELQRLSCQIEIPDSHVTQSAVQSFYHGDGSLPHLFSSEQTGGFIQETYHAEERDRKWRASVCCMCAVAGMGIAYAQESTLLGQAQQYYNVAKNLFSDLIEVRSIDAIKVCLLLAMFNAAEQSTLALLHLETASSLARYYGVHCSQRNARMPDDVWIDGRKTWRTLLLFKGWLCSTLGYMTGEDVLSDDSVKFEDLELDSGSSVYDMIETEMAKLSNLQAKILRLDLDLKNSETPGTVHSLSRALESWLQHLPSPLRLEALGQGAGTPVDLRRAVYNVHLLFHGARMLLYRRILSQHARKEADLASTNQAVLDEPTLLQALREGRDVAEFTMRTLRILQHEEDILKRCRLVIFQAFTASALILYEASQKQLHHFRPGICQKDLDTARWPLNTLEICAERDCTARKYYQALSPHFEDMKAHQAKQIPYSPISSQVEDGPFAAQYLCKIPDGDTDMVERSLSLRRLLCRPFGELQKRYSLISKDEHLTWHAGASEPSHW